MRQGANFSNINPKLQKKSKPLKWFYYTLSEIDSTIYIEQSEIKQNMLLKTQAHIKNNYPYLYYPYNQPSYRGQSSYKLTKPKPSAYIKPLSQKINIELSLR